MTAVEIEGRACEVVDIVMVEEGESVVLVGVIAEVVVDVNVVDGDTEVGVVVEDRYLVATEIVGTVCVVVGVVLVEEG